METFSLISELFIRKDECDDIILIVVQVFKIANGDKGPPPVRLQAILPVCAGVHLLCFPLEAAVVTLQGQHRGAR